MSHNGTDPESIQRQRRHKLEALFDAGFELSLPERAALLARECAGDAHLRREVEDMFQQARQPTHSELKQRLLDARRESDNDTLLATSGVESDEDAVRLLAPGFCIGQYEIIRELGRGGMGAVFLARDLKLGRRVAIKFLHTDLPELTARFVLEARATARCTHENIVVIHDANEFAGHPYMVLEYLKGTPLSEFIARGKVPPNRAVELIAPVVCALECAHTHNIVHRDLKPDNILLTESGGIKVVDFGIAKFLSHLPDEQSYDDSEHRDTFIGASALTQQGVVVGTLPYMAPEQWNTDEVDHRCDIWAIGIILFKMLTGKHPLAPLRGMQLGITAVLDQPMPSAHDAGVSMPRELADVVDRCLAKPRTERFANARSLLEALEPLLPGRYGRQLESGENPYAGLTSFQESDANRFFGRAREIARMLAQLHEQPLVGVVGPSGIGKSSFVRAGVIPELKHSGEAWEALIIRPGRYPLAALASVVAPMLADECDTLSERLADHQDAVERLYAEPGYLGTVLRTRARRHNRQIVLFVDQFEELYTLNPDVRERMAFTACLSAMADDAIAPLRVILSIRSDFLDRVSEDGQFMAELVRSLFFLTAPDRDGLRDAIVQPAEMAGVRFETATTVDNMLDWLEATPGSLPLLQFTAARLWDARDRQQRLFTGHSYKAIGGIAGALASHADSVLSSLSRSEHALVRGIFLRLVTAERTRAIVSVTELGEIFEERAEVTRLVDHLVDARLLVVFGDMRSTSSVELVHESLIHTWPTLTRWLDESQEDAAYLDQLRAAARQWRGRGRPTILLWRGEAAEEARRWSRRYRGRLAPLQKEYLTAVFARAARVARRQRFLILGTICFLLALVVAASVALVVIRNAERQARDNARVAQAAEQQAKVAEQQARASEQQARAAVKQAQEQARRAQIAEAEAKRQLELADKKERQRRVAQKRADSASAEVVQSKADLAQALAQARQANKALEQALDAARERTERLQKRAGKHSTTLQRKTQNHERGR